MQSPCPIETESGSQRPLQFRLGTLFLVITAFAIGLSMRPVVIFVQNQLVERTQNVARTGIGAATAPMNTQKSRLQFSNEIVRFQDLELSLADLTYAYDPRMLKWHGLTVEEIDEIKRAVEAIDKKARSLTYKLTSELREAHSALNCQPPDLPEAMARLDAIHNFQIPSIQHAHSTAVAKIAEQTRRRAARETMRMLHDTFDMELDHRPESWLRHYELTGTDGFELKSRAIAQ